MDKAPDAYRTISEVGEDLDLPQHVLRFWETRFPQIKPLKRGGGRRYYRPDDVELLKGIRHLLYKEGYTIKGVQRILKEQGPRAVMAFARSDLPEFEAQEPLEAQAPVVAYTLPQASAAPPAYAPPPPPVHPAPVYPAPVEAPAFTLPPIEMLPLDASVAAQALQPAPVPLEAGTPPPEADQALPEAAPLSPGAFSRPPAALPLPPEEATPPRAQVSMFRGGLHRAEPAMEGTVPASPPASYTSSAYVAPAAPQPGQARVLLVQALEELSAVRAGLDRLLAARHSAG